jgi:pimeloyl-ACP methyl ester carboxylesterase
VDQDASLRGMGEIRVHGRRVRYEEFGPAGGAVVFVAHGTPGSRLGVRPSDGALHRLGIRAVTYDRPGYGESDRAAGRTVADAAGDVAAIADAVGAERFAVYGISGGGPHALACAALLPQRVTRAAALVGVAPFRASGLDWFAGQTPSNVEEFQAAVAGESALTKALTPMVGPFREDPASLLDALEAELSDEDRAVIRGQAVRDMLVTGFGEALRQGVGGWVDDDLAFVEPWGFDLTAIETPTLLWHGTEDRLAPISHSEWLSRHIPTARLVRVPHAGHMSAFAVQDEVIAWLHGHASTTA